MANPLSGAEWTVTAVLHDSAGNRICEMQSIRWADSFVGSYHHSHLGHAIQIAMADAWNRTFPRRKTRGVVSDR